MVGGERKRWLLNRFAEGQGGGGGGGEEAPLRTRHTAGAHAAPAAHAGKAPRAGGRRQKKTSEGEGGEPLPACLAGGKGGKSATVEGGVGEMAAGVPRRQQAREKRNGSREGGGAAADVPRRRQSGKNSTVARGRGGQPPASHASGKGGKNSTVGGCVREVVRMYERGSTSRRRTACSYAVAGGGKHATREARTRGARARDRSPGGAPSYCSGFCAQSRRRTAPSENPAQDVEGHKGERTQTPGSRGAERTRTPELTQTHR